VRYLLLAHGGIVDVGGGGRWGEVLDAAEAHMMVMQRQDSALTTLLKHFAGFGPEAKAFRREDLPSPRLPQFALGDPMPVTWLR